MYRWYFHEARSRASASPRSSSGTGSFTSDSRRSSSCMRTWRTTSARLGDGAGLVEVVVAGVGHPGSVRGLVVDQQAEGPLWVAALQEVQALLSDDVGGVAGQLLLAVRADHHGVDVGALVGVDPPVVEAARPRLLGATQVPLAVQRRLVALLLQDLRERRHPVVELGVDRGSAVDVAVGAGQDRGARGREIGRAHV